RGDVSGTLQVLPGEADDTYPGMPHLEGVLPDTVLGEHLGQAVRTMPVRLTDDSHFRPPQLGHRNGSTGVVQEAVLEIGGREPGIRTSQTHPGLQWTFGSPVCQGPPTAAPYTPFAFSVGQDQCTYLSLFDKSLMECRIHEAHGRFTIHAQESVAQAPPGGGQPKDTDEGGDLFRGDLPGVQCDVVATALRPRPGNNHVHGTPVPAWKTLYPRQVRRGPATGEGPGTQRQLSGHDRGAKESIAVGRVDEGSHGVDPGTRVSQ